MWNWLTEAVSSPHSHSGDHHERNNYMFFYEKMEALVEAARIMNRGTGEVTNPARQVKEKEKLQPVQTPEIIAQPGRLSKPTRLIEKAASQPAAVIDEVFSLTTLNELQMYLLPNWLRVAVTNTESPYSVGNGREILYDFYEQLLPFVEALYINSTTDIYHTSLYLNEEQYADPDRVITAFFQQFPMEYVRRELADFLEAGIGYDGNYPNGFSPWQALMTYNHMLCLIEAAYRLYIDQQMQSVTDVLSRETAEAAEID